MAPDYGLVLHLLYVTRAHLSTNDLPHRIRLRAGAIKMNRLS